MGSVLPVPRGLWEQSPHRASSREQTPTHAGLWRPSHSQEPVLWKEPWTRGPLCPSLTTGSKHVTSFWASVSTLFQTLFCSQQLVNKEVFITKEEKKKSTVY